MHHGILFDRCLAYTQHIFDLPTIPIQDVYQIPEFCNKLPFLVLGKLELVNGYVAMTLDKLPAICRRGHHSGEKYMGGVCWRLGR